MRDSSISTSCDYLLPVHKTHQRNAFTQELLHQVLHWMSSMPQTVAELITSLSAVLYEVTNWPEDLQAKGNTWTLAKLVVKCQWARHKSKSIFPEYRRGTWSWATRQNVICGSSNHSLIGLHETPAFSMSLPKGRDQPCNPATSHAQPEPQTEILRVNSIITSSWLQS